MSQMKAIKTFRDLLAFLTIIPLGKTDDFVVTFAEPLLLFPSMGGFIALLTAAYFAVYSFLITHIFSFISSLSQFPVELLTQILPAVMTLAFILFLTRLPHFDGLVDLGNAVGVGDIRERRAAAYMWTVAHKGTVLAIFIEFLAILTLFLMKAEAAFGVIIAAEVAAKLCMDTIVCLRKSAHSGLSALLVEVVKRKRNLAAYFLAILIAFPLLGWLGFLAIFASVLLGALIYSVSHNFFSGVSGDAIGATNEITRATVLLLMAWVLMS